MFDQKQAGVSAPPNAGEIASRWSDVLTAGDVAAVEKLFTENSAFVGGTCAAAKPCKGPADIAKRVQDAVAAHQKQTLVGTPQVAGNLVQLQFESRTDASRAAGVERWVSVSNATVQGDKIASWLAFADLRDAQTLKYQQVQQAKLASPAPAASK